MAKSLYNLIQQNQSNGKTPIGYNVQSYKDVLAKLQKDAYGDSSGDTVMGVTRVDYSGVQNLGFDSNGISTNETSCIWKMNLMFSGSIPVQYQNYYDIAKFQNQSTQNVSQNPFCHASSMCPLSLDEETYARIQVEDFKVGSSFDLQGLAVQYFSKFYSSNTQEINAEMVKKLFENNLLRAQVILPDKNKSILIDVIGQTPNGYGQKNACCVVSTPLIGSNEWDGAGIVLKINDGTGQQQLLPNGTTYTFPAKGGGYYLGSSKMTGMSKTQYKKWLEQSSEKYGSEVVLKLIKPSVRTCYVKLYVPESKKNQSLQFLPQGISQLLYQEYPGQIKEVSGSAIDPSIFEGEIRTRMMGVCEKWKDVQVSVLNGGFYYSQPKRPHRLYRNKGGTYNRSGRDSVRALFGTKNGDGYFDCSSLPFLFWYDTNILKDDVMDAPTFSTGTMSTVPSVLSALLKPNYKIITMDINSSTQILAGDILWVQTKDGTGKHHAAMAYPKDGKMYTLEIGDSTNSKIRNVCTYNSRSENNTGRCHYKHLLRVVEQQQQ